MTRYGKLRRDVHQLLEPAAKHSVGERAGNVALSGLIVANVLAVVLESVPSLSVRFGTAFDRFETLSIAAFTFEYVLRIWTCVELPQFRHPIIGRVRFALSPMALLDLAAIAPAYMASVSVELRFVRIVRLVRMLRVLRLARYSSTLRTFADVLASKRPEVTLILVFLSVLVVLASSLMFMVQNEALPEQFSSIPAAMWWSVATLTTVGYGDIYPITPLGKFLGAIIALIGIGFFVLPAGLLAAAFAEELLRQGRSKCCPHCGKELG